MPLPAPNVAVREALWQRAVLAEFVRRGRLEEAAAVAMLGWPHSGFGAYLGPPIEEHEALLRMARYSARAPVAESRLRYNAARAEVELVSDRHDGPSAGVHRMTALEFQAPGYRAVTWNRRDQAGRPVPSGVYFYRLTLGSDKATRRAVVIE